MAQSQLPKWSTVSIEAKAQQGFYVAQMEKLKEARALMVASSLWPAKDIRLLALASSLYSPGPKTRAAFDAFCTWRAVARMYPDNAAVYERADSIYGDRR
jgi:hypothetical protein